MGTPRMAILPRLVSIIAACSTIPGNALEPFQRFRKIASTCLQGRRMRFRFNSHLTKVQK